jgi:hypothetical protein
MSDKKRKLYRLIEHYINDFRGEAVEEMYGKGTKIKIHNMYESHSTNSVVFEAIIYLGETINEQVMDRALADVLIQDALVYFFPEKSVKTIVRYDV